MNSRYTKLNLEKSKESVSRGAERTIVREHSRTYKNDVANFSNSASILIYHEHKFSRII
ncbi:MAG TPA: palindromic element RPE5 domain-containing protein [Rickettsia endosymbiont of Pyrocoelia pectoralis]|nr:palindromic element RPE5 domain-containing protein [Rickettsia endosymbiont of Pyrocoelia pectoralis]